MTTLSESGITINILADPGEQQVYIGDLEGYDDIREALDIALQSKVTHPNEFLRINRVHEKWKVCRVVPG